MSQDQTPQVYCILLGGQFGNLEVGKILCMFSRAEVYQEWAHMFTTTSPADYLVLRSACVFVGMLT